jgi:hypothetical protein
MGIGREEGKEKREGGRGEGEERRGKGKFDSCWIAYGRIRICGVGF